MVLYSSLFFLYAFVLHGYVQVSVFSQNFAMAKVSKMIAKHNNNMWFGPWGARNVPSLSQVKLCGSLRFFCFPYEVLTKILEDFL